eukprot:1144158-Pelagomonas_calceolata.AAC.3
MKLLSTVALRQGSSSAAQLVERTPMCHLEALWAVPAISMHANALGLAACHTPSTANVQALIACLSPSVEGLLFKDSVVQQRSIDLLVQLPPAMLTGAGTGEAEWAWNGVQDKEKTARNGAILRCHRGCCPSAAACSSSVADLLQHG